MKQASIIYRRTSSGSMLILTSITILLIVSVFMLCFTLHNLLFQCDRCQQSSDSLVIDMAGAMNSNDRISQINEMEARSRELIFNSRQHLNACAQRDLSFLAPLCDKFVVEARDGHSLIELERKNQIEQICRELCLSAERQNKIAQQGGWTLAGVTTNASVIERIEAGRVDGVESNVPAARLHEELLEHDMQRGFLQKGSMLFRAGVNAKLPGEDGDLDFMLSGLPACVEGVSAATRNVNTEVFVPFGVIYERGKASVSKFSHLPNAVRISSVLAADLNGNQRTSVKIFSVGAANGALCSLD
ncbi:MAG: hypothetical protein K2W95_34570 [Candidatus Obscuribacterales bacterium]|nr:hypothetical protein [Candidatus Obscuribacterales bacterium]